jgi:hypothetical protein
MSSRNGGVNGSTSVAAANRSENGPETELRFRLQEAQAKVEELQKRLDDEVKRSAALVTEVNRLQASTGKCAATVNPEAGQSRIFSEESFEVFNSMALVVHVVDWHQERTQILWGNKATCDIFAKESVDGLRKIDLRKSSEQMRNLQKEMYEHIQVQKKVYGPERRAFPLPSGNAVFDVVQFPIRMQVGGEAEPRDVCLNYFLPVLGEEANRMHVYAQFMLERVSSMAMLFAQGSGELIQMNTSSRAHFSPCMGSANMKLHDVLQAFEWEDEAEIDATLNKINELEIGGGAVVFERAMKRPAEVASDTAEPGSSFTAKSAAAQKWLSLKFIASLDPTVGRAQRVAILVNGQDVSEQRQARSDWLAMSNQQEQFFAEVAHVSALRFLQLRLLLSVSLGDAYLFASAARMQWDVLRGPWVVPRQAQVLGCPRMRMTRCGEGLGRSCGRRYTASRDCPRR